VTAAAAIIGVWMFAGCCALSKEVTALGWALSIAIAVATTAVLV
jgi:hypothetical protein